MKRIITTVGPSLLYETPISTVHQDTYIYRINGAHGSPDDIEKHINEIRKQVPSADILMDLPGNKVRSRGMETPLQFEAGVPFELTSENTNYPDFFKHLEKGMVIIANESIFKFTIQELSENRIVLISNYSGQLLNNKGLHVGGIHKDIPFLFEKDKDLIKLANKHKLSFVGLSFVRTVEDIDSAKALIDGPEIISKVETRAAVENLNEILQSVDNILVDRGDLSTEVGLEKIPAYQRFIVDRCLFYNKRAFLATQFLKNMEEKPIPTIAEVIDMYNTFKMGVYGVQLSEETAIGKYPRECLDTINHILKEIEAEIH